MASKSVTSLSKHRQINIQAAAIRIKKRPCEIRKSRFRGMSDNCVILLSVNEDGYGRVRVADKMMKAHRVVFENHNGKIDMSLDIDHLCRERGCIQPHHMEQVSRGVNTLRGESFAAKNARKTHCINGHPFDDDNTLATYSYKNGKRFGKARKCKKCATLSTKKYLERKRKNDR
ncbi:HNH endonuclease [uncultured Paraglaciecola sp.]|uniref:HNH endonuclease n=1 Tax=uncultured Paraglaciecola sp. TaxID=1765024 RepID=UPI00260EBBA7|nr:HNH endonuclease [uncultured Paraglaciecola sp.]